jgi:hypothetical protein
LGEASANYAKTTVSFPFQLTKYDFSLSILLMSSREYKLLKIVGVISNIVSCFFRNVGSNIVVDVMAIN